MSTTTPIPQDVTKPALNEENAKNVTFPPRVRIKFNQDYWGKGIDWHKYLSITEHAHLIQQEKYNYLGAISDYEHAMELLKAEKARSQKLIEALEFYRIKINKNDLPEGYGIDTSEMPAEKAIAEYRGGNMAD